MKKTAENRYPHSATLFKFCKEALELRYEGNVKVIDQDVGAILGYDPADCSHWKKGKKNIRALSTLKNIAEHLNVDERLLIDIASGKMDLPEAVFEYKGYGQFSFNGTLLETLKKEFFKNPTKWQKNPGLKTFEELFDVRRQQVAKVAYDVLQKGSFKEAPIYLPEVLQLFPSIRLEIQETLTQPLQIEVIGEPGESYRTIIRIANQEMRPYLRFLIAKELFKTLSRSLNPIALAFKDAPEEVLEVQSNLFATILLVPGTLLRKEVEKIDSSLDIILQLSEIFWVSKALMNQRLADFMEHLD